MRDELLGPKVENVGVAVVQSLNELNEKLYNDENFENKLNSIQ